MMPMTNSPGAPLPAVLCVDDEPNILSSLRRLLRGKGYDVLTAGSGASALEILAVTPVDLVISDMRMPEMDGAQLLERVRLQWPAAVRMLLTGHSDIESTIAAINRGAIARYIRKPWTDSDVLMAVDDALSRRALEREAARLAEEVRHRNEELRELNATLEARIDRRTHQLKEAVTGVTRANEQLKAAFFTSVRVFSNLVELREDCERGKSRRIADLARRVALRLGLGPEAAQDAMLAGLLRDVGRIGLPEALARKPSARLTGEELAQLRRALLKGEAALMPLASLEGAARAIRAQHEDFDGTGFPDGLAGQAIDARGRVLAATADFEDLQAGAINGRAMTAQQARTYLREHAGRRYDPAVVEALLAMLDESPALPATPGRTLAPAELGAGMVLARDLEGRDGVLLLAADHVVDAALIGRIREYERTTAGEKLVVVVKAPARTPTPEP